MFFFPHLSVSSHNCMFCAVPTINCSKQQFYPPPGFLTCGVSNYKPMTTSWGVLWISNDDQPMVLAQRWQLLGEGLLKFGPNGQKSLFFHSTKEGGGAFFEEKLPALELKTWAKNCQLGWFSWLLGFEIFLHFARFDVHFSGIAELCIFATVPQGLHVVWFGSKSRQTGRGGLSFKKLPVSESYHCLAAQID